MLPLEVGKLYSCSKYFLLLYPDTDSASLAFEAGKISEPFYAASYWSKQFGKSVSYCNPKTPLLVLAVEEKYIEVLVGDKRGWIINIDWLEIKELISKAA
jgi:hypothetical protein